MKKAMVLTIAFFVTLILELRSARCMRIFDHLSSDNDKFRPYQHMDSRQYSACRLCKAERFVFPFFYHLLAKILALIIERARVKFKNFINKSY